MADFDDKLITESDDPNSWVDLHGDYLYNFAVSRVYVKELAEDLVQDTFLSAVKSFGQFQKKSAIRTWLTSILKNKIIDHYKKKSTQNEVGQEHDPENSNQEEYFNSSGRWHEATRPKLWDTDFQTPVEKSEFYEVLNKCLEHLPTQWSAVFALKNIDDLDSKEICKELGISSSNYWVIMHRSKLELRKCMGKNWFNEK